MSQETAAATVSPVNTPVGRVPKVDGAHHALGLTWVDEDVGVVPVAHQHAAAEGGGSGLHLLFVIKSLSQGAKHVTYIEKSIALSRHLSVEGVEDREDEAELFRVLHVLDPGADAAEVLRAQGV